MQDYTDNGFPSRAAMDAAHTQILACVPSGVRSVIDFGAGNGLLLKKIAAATGARIVLGVERDADRCRRSLIGASLRHLELTDVAEQFVGDDAPIFELGVIAARRLSEMTQAQRQAFDGWVAQHVAAVLVYSYDAPTFVRLLAPRALAAFPAKEGIY